MARALTWEQDSSALEELRRAGIRAGGVSEVLLVTGSVPDASKPAHLAFCSARIHHLRVVERGPRFQRVMPLSSRRLLFGHEEEIAQKIMGRRGFAVMRGRIITLTSGVVGFDMDPASLKVFASPCTYLRFSGGKEEAGNILRAELKLLV